LRFYNTVLNSVKKGEKLYEKETLTFGWYYPPATTGNVISQTYELLTDEKN